MRLAVRENWHTRQRCSKRTPGALRGGRRASGGRWRVTGSKPATDTKSRHSLPWGRMPLVECDGCCVGCLVAEDLFGKCGAAAQLGVQADPPSREVRSTPTDTKPMVECDFEGSKGTNAPELPPFGEDGPGVERRASEVGCDAHGLHRVCPTHFDRGSQTEVERARATVHPRAWSRKRRFISRFEPSAELRYAHHQEHKP